MAPDPTTGALKPALSPTELFNLAPKIQDFANVEIQFITNIDSSDMTSNEWTQIISTIREKQKNVDAFVITHGTDTMVETGNAIAFAFGNTIEKPIVLTGSQAAPFQLGSDAVVNLERAVRTAITATVPEVYLSFHDFVYRATRAQKISERKLAAFHSPAVPPLAEHMGDDIHWHEPRLKMPCHKPFFFNEFNERVISTSLHAAADAEYLHQILLAQNPQERIHGLIWSSLGAGNVPERHHKTILDANTKHIPIVVTSQFPGGKLNMKQYEPGRKALELGVIPAHDMTEESATVKLKWALSLAEHAIHQNTISKSELSAFIQTIFQHNRANEVTLDTIIQKEIPFG